MTNIILNVEGITKLQAKELINEINSIQGIEAQYYLQESRIEFKKIVVPIVLKIVGGIAGGIIRGLITHQILKFFEKEKSLDKKPIIINYGDINIIQGESQNEIENKVKNILEKKNE